MTNFGDRWQGKPKTWQIILCLTLLAGMSFALAFYFTLLFMRNGENRGESVTNRRLLPTLPSSTPLPNSRLSNAPVAFQALPEMPDGRQPDLYLEIIGLELAQILDPPQLANMIASAPLPSKPQPIAQLSQLATPEIRSDRSTKTPEQPNTEQPSNSISLPRHIRAKATTIIALNFEPKGIAEGNSEPVIFVTLAEPLKDATGRTLLPTGTRWSALPRLLRNPMVEELNPKVQILELEAIAVTIAGVEYKIPPGKVTIRGDDDLPLFAEKKSEKKIDKNLTNSAQEESLETDKAEIKAFFLPKGIKVRLTVKDAVQVALSN